MKTRNLKGAVALGSLTAAVALLAGLSGASAQSAPGAGSFPQSFLIPGTNTSLSVYGVVRMNASTQVGSIHTNDTSPSGGGATAFQINQLPLEGPGANGGASANQLERSQNGGLRASVKTTNIAFETRTPSALGEIKTVLLMDFGLFASQNNYVGSPVTLGVTGSNKPSAGAGNNEAPRIQWAYGTIGPWLIGQWNSGWTDPALNPSDIGDPSITGYITTANVRVPQIRYTYLVGNGITLQASLESMVSGAIGLVKNTGAMTTGSVTQFASDNLDPGGIVNLPTFNFGASWDQPWGHIMGRFGFQRDEFRNSTGANSIINGALGLNGTSNGANNLTQFAWAIETGAAINTFGQDQWKILLNYSNGAPNYLTDLSPTNAGGFFVNGFTGQKDTINEFAFNTSYTHRFNPNWRTTAEFGMGFFSKPSGAAGLTNCANNGVTATCVPGGATAAQLAGLEKTHLNSALSATWALMPGMVEFTAEWDHWERWVQASSTNSRSNKYGVTFNFYW